MALLSGRIMGSCGHNYTAVIDTDDWPAEDRMDTRGLPGVGPMFRDTVPCIRCRAFAAGGRVRCDDATDGANFLVFGKEYIVESTQRDSEGNIRLNLVGMARAWETRRFTAIDGPVPAE